MRILWFSSHPFPEACRHFGFPESVKGGWVPSLGHALHDSRAVTLGVASVYPVDSAKKQVIEGVTHYLIPDHGESGAYEKGQYCSEQLIARCLAVVQDFQPDLIHIHGTERFYGLLSAAKRFPCPAVISIQGIIYGYVQHYFGQIDPRDLRFAAYSPECVTGQSLPQQLHRWRLRGSIEQVMVARNTHFIGRTLWDRAQILAVCPNATYFTCQEMMRPPFYVEEWSPERMTPYTIFTTAAADPLKGFHWLLRALAILKHHFPAVRVRVTEPAPAGKQALKWYPRYLQSIIRQYDLVENVEFIGKLSADAVARELAHAHVFAIPSLIENSPNSLAEAMLVGTPCVASLCGGIPSMIDDGVNALGFPPGDAAVLAECLRMIFTDQHLAGRLSEAARTVAHARHDRQMIVQTMLDIYRQMIAHADHG